MGTQPFQAIYWKDTWFPFRSWGAKQEAQGSSVECATSPLALPGISWGHFAVTKLSTGGLWPLGRPKRARG